MEFLGKQSSGRLALVDDNQVEKLIKYNQDQTTRVIEEIFFKAYMRFIRLLKTCLCEPLQCLCYSCYNEKNELHLRLQFSTQIQQDDTFCFESGCWWWKTDYFQQCEAKECPKEKRSELTLIILLDGVYLKNAMINTQIFPLNQRCIQEDYCCQLDR